MQILAISRKPTSQTYHEKIVQITTIDWKNIYLLPTNTTLNTASWYDRKNSFECR